MNIAPAIVNGLFYAVLAVIAGSAIVANGGGGIVPMRSQWEKMLNRVELEASRIQSRAEAMTPSERQTSRAPQAATAKPRPQDEQGFTE